MLVCSKNKSEKIDFILILSLILGLLESTIHHQIEKNMIFHIMYSVPLQLA